MYIYIHMFHACSCWLVNIDWPGAGGGGGARVYHPQLYPKAKDWAAPSPGVSQKEGFAAD